MTPHPKFQIVIAHYNEDLGPYEAFGKQSIIYTKSPAGTQFNMPAGAELLRLPNHGRDCHTHLYHIVHNYDKLADITLFTQADPFDHLDHGWTVEDMVGRAQQPSVDGVQCFRMKPIAHWDGVPWSSLNYLRRWRDGQGSGLQRSRHTPAQAWSHITGDPKHPDRVFSVDGAIFAARADTVRAVPLETWRRALALFDEAPHVNPEMGVIMETFFAAMMSPMYRQYVAVGGAVPERCVCLGS